MVNEPQTGQAIGTSKDLMASYKELNRNVYAVMATHLLQFAPQ